MTRLFSILWLSMVLLSPPCAAAQEAGVMADVAIGVQQDGKIWSGQQVTLNLDLKTTGFSFSNTHFNLPEVSAAFLLQTDTTTIKMSESKDGQRWQVIRYPLALYPQKPGLLTIPPIDVRFSSSAGYGSMVKDFEFQTGPLQLQVSQPPGVGEDERVVSTRSFQLEHNWEGVTDRTKTGDALTLTVKRRAADISAMLLPPLPVFRTGGLAAYPQTPDVTDQTDRGSLVGERIDSIIWVAEKAGSYHIPGIRFQWWDPIGRKLRQQVVPGIDLEISLPATHLATAETGAKSEFLPGKLLAWLLFVIVVFVGAVLRRRSPKQEDAKNSIDERSAFSALCKACKNNDAGQAYLAMHRWMALHAKSSASRTPPLTLEEFARSLNDGQLAEDLRTLQTSMVAPSSEWRGRSLLSSIQRMRGKLKARKAKQSAHQLAPLNP